MSSPLFLSLSFYRFLVGCVYTSVHYLSLRRKSTFVFDLVSVCTRERANLIWAFSSSSLVVTEDWLRCKEAGENAVIWPFKNRTESLLFLVNSAGTVLLSALSSLLLERAGRVYFFFFPCILSPHSLR